MDKVAPCSVCDFNRGGHCERLNKRIGDVVVCTYAPTALTIAEVRIHA